MTSQIHDLVSNDPILDSKVVPDELGRPAERLAQPGWPGLPSPTARSCLPAGGLLCGGGGARAKEGGSAQENPAPPLLSPQVGYFISSYMFQWLIITCNKVAPAVGGTEIARLVRV